MLTMSRPPQLYSTTEVEEILGYTYNSFAVLRNKEKETIPRASYKYGRELKWTDKDIEALLRWQTRRELARR
jgi:hypothetical protein